MTAETRATVGDWLAVADGRMPMPAAVFGSFISVWIAFNALYSARRPGPERRAVLAYATTEDTRHRHQQLLLTPDYLGAVNVLAAKGIRGGRRRITVEDVTDSERIFECVYEIRCNLFYGDKRPENQRDQQVVEAARVIVSAHLRAELEA
jgi:hypothetical protein